MGDIKIDDLLQVFINGGVSMNLFEVYNIFKSEGNEYIFECFEVAIDKDRTILRSQFTEYISDFDVVGVLKPLKKLNDDKQTGTLDKSRTL